MQPKKPLTKNMMESLIECYIRELTGTPSHPLNTKYCKGLLARGMVEVRSPANGNSFQDALCVTITGREIVEPIYNKVFKTKVFAIS